MDFDDENNMNKKLIPSKSSSNGDMHDMGDDLQTPSRSQNRSTLSSPVSHAAYEELLNGGVPCPTCKGYGRIPKEQEGQLVALIPLKDKRLKPRRTFLYVLLAVIVCLVGACLTVFFLIPRNVNLATTTLYITPYFIFINETENYVAMSLYNPFNVQNDNYLPITINGAQMTVIYDSKQLNQSVNATAKSVKLRTTDEYGVKMNLTFDQKREKIASFCTDPRRWVHDLYMEFSVTVNYTCLGHTNQVVLSKGKLVDCGGNTSTVFYNELKKYGW